MSGEENWAKGAREAFFAAIKADPQAHIDALVEAGVLEKACRTYQGVPEFVYLLVQPHKHEWRVKDQVIKNGTVLVYCATCPPNALTHNRLPIEVPDA